MKNLREMMAFYIKSMIFFSIAAVIVAALAIIADIRHNEIAVKSCVMVLGFFVGMLLLSIFMKSRYQHDMDIMQEKLYLSIPTDNYVRVMFNFEPKHNKEYFSYIHSNLKIYAQRRPDDIVSLLVISEMYDDEISIIVHTMEIKRKKSSLKLYTLKNLEIQ